jgi:excisionase family DNA binding protein
MRLEDWQKWLDSQFLDDDVPLPQEEAARPAPTAAAEPSSQQAAVSPQTYAPTDSPAASVTASAHVAAPPAAYTPLPSAIPTAPPPAPAAPDTHLVDDVDVPSIERYLPFLRTTAARNEPPPPAADTALDETPAADAAIQDITSVSAPSDTPAEDKQEPITAGEEPISGETELSPVATTESSAPHSSADSPPDAAAGATDNEAQGELGFASELPPVSRFAGGARRIAISRKRVRTARNARPAEHVESVSADEFWNLVPRHVHSLIAMGSDDVTQHSYKRDFRESRLELIQRLLDPTLSLEETARLLNVCPTTVRRYTNRGLLRHQRTTGDQRRFKLSDVLAFLESQSRAS